MDEESLGSERRQTSPPDLSRLPLQELEARLAGSASYLAAAECEFLDLLAEFDARTGWGETGMQSAAHWLSLRVGLRLGVAREKVRVARALQRLPLVHDAFAAGSMSYCKVRAISRVATETTEAELVEIAHGASGAQLERVVREWRRCLVPERAASAFIRRTLRRRVDDDGSVVYTLRLTPEEAPVFDNAVAAARRAVLDDAGRVVETPEEEALAEHLTEDSSTQRADADAVLLLAESFLADGPKGEAGDRHLVMVHADLEALAEAAAEEAARAARPQQVTPDGPRTVAATAGDMNPGDVSAETPAGVSAETPAAAGELPTGGSVFQASLARRPATCVTEDGEPISASTVLRKLCESPGQLMIRATDGHALDLGRTRRHADLRQRRAIRVRDGGSCRFPGCMQRRRLVPHHSHWWVRGGNTDLDLLVSLCPTHHRAVHELGYDVRALGRGRFAWFRPSGEEIPTSLATSSDPPSWAREDGADDQAAPAALVAAAERIAPTWGGGRLDLDHLIGGWAANLLIRDGHRLTDIPYAELDDALRRAARWPTPPADHDPFGAHTAA